MHRFGACGTCAGKGLFIGIINHLHISDSDTFRAALKLYRVRRVLSGEMPVGIETFVFLRKMFGAIGGGTHTGAAFSGTRSGVTGPFEEQKTGKNTNKMHKFRI